MAKNILLRTACCLAIMLATAGFLWSHRRTEVVPPHDSVTNFPSSIGEWRGREMAMDPQVLEVLGPGDFSERLYSRANEPYVDLFLAYFPSQKTGDAIHSPKNCLPGSGWTPLHAGHITIPAAKPIVANRYVIARGNQRQLVIYWYQSHGRAVASEYWAKYYLVADSIRLNRTDAALVRVVTPIDTNEEIQAAENRAVDFARQIAPDLDRYIPQ